MRASGLRGSTSLSSRSHRSTSRPSRVGPCGGAFGAALRKLVCVAKAPECSGCLLVDRCLYSTFFETPTPAGSEVLRLYPRAPHPFALAVPYPQPPEVPPGQILRVGIVLIGEQAIESTPFLLIAWERVADTGLGRERTRCRLRGVEAVHGTERRQVYDPASRKLERTLPTFTEADFAVSPDRQTTRTIDVRFRTPARLRLAREIVASPSLPFHALFRNALRRLSSLLYFHCGGRRLDLDFKGLIARAEAVRTVSSDLRYIEHERFSRRQGRAQPLGGLLGRVRYEGENLQYFLPVLRAAELVGVGKGTGFGLGRISLEVERDRANRCANNREPQSRSDPPCA